MRQAFLSKSYQISGQRMTTQSVSKRQTQHRHLNFHIYIEYLIHFTNFGFCSEYFLFLQNQNLSFSSDR